MSEIPTELAMKVFEEIADVFRKRGIYVPEFVDDDTAQLFTRIEELEREIVDLNNSRTNDSILIGQLRSQAEQAEDELDEVRGDYHMTRERCDQLTEDLAQLEYEYHNTVEERDAYKERVVELEQQITDEPDRLKKEVAHLTNKQTHTERAWRAMVLQRNELRGRIVDLEAERSLLKTQVNYATQERDDAWAKNSELIRLNDTYRAELLKAQHECEEMRHSLENARAEIDLAPSQTESELRDLRQTYFKTRNQLMKAELARDKAMEQGAASVDKYERLAAQYSELRDRVESMHTANLDMSKLLMTRQAEVEQLVDDIRAVRDTLGMTLAERADLQRLLFQLLMDGYGIDVGDDFKFDAHGNAVAAEVIAYMVDKGLILRERVVAHQSHETLAREVEGDENDGRDGELVQDTGEYLNARQDGEPTGAGDTGGAGGAGTGGHAATGGDERGAEVELPIHGGGGVLDHYGQK